MGADHGPESVKRYPYRHPQRDADQEPAENHWFWPCGRLFYCQFLSKRRSCLAVKTDRIDVESLRHTVIAWCSGDPIQDATDEGVDGTPKTLGQIECRADW